MVSANPLKEYVTTAFWSKRLEQKNRLNAGRGRAFNLHGKSKEKTCAFLQSKKKPCPEHPMRQRPGAAENRKITSAGGGKIS